MKHSQSLLLVISLVCLLMPDSFAEGESGKYAQPDPFTIVKRTKDTTLAAGTSVLIMNFRGGINTRQKTEIRFGYNKKELKIKTDTNGRVVQPLPSGKYKLYFYLNSTYNEVITDSIKLGDQEILEVTVRFLKAERDLKVKKPVIYVYPKEKTAVEIQLDINGKLGFTWPVYHEKWEFTAAPDGKIEMGGKEYNYLFWESDMPEYALDKNDGTGFLVSSDTLLSFLENSLDQMGFTASEAADFITFWYPQMIGNETNQIHFLFNEACDNYAQLHIVPTPDQVYRVGMIWGKASGNVTPDPQEIPKIDRSGFTVIEWGGMETEMYFEK